MNKSNTNLSIIVYSCLRNSDMWSVFSDLFHKYWGDCQYKVYLLTDYFDKKNEYVFDEVICCDSDWADMILTALKTVNTPYVMLFMDDYLLTSMVNNADIEDALGVIRMEHAANLRMCFTNLIKAQPYEKNARCGCFLPGTAYALSTHVGIWDASFLMKIVKPGWSAWDFERVGSMEIKKFGQPVLLLNDYVFPYVEGVRKGRWLPEGIDVCKKNEIELDYTVRPKMSWKENLIIHFKGVIIKMNPNLVLSIQNKFSERKKSKL